MDCWWSLHLADYSDKNNNSLNGNNADFITSFCNVCFLTEASVVINSLEEPGVHGPLGQVPLVDRQ